MGFDKERKQNVICWMAVGYRIRELRLLRDISCTELAEIANISRSYLSNIERGQRSPGVDIVVALAQALSVSIDYLIRGIRPIIGAGNCELRFRSDKAAEELESEWDDEE